MILRFQAVKKSISKCKIDPEHKIKHCSPIIKTPYSTNSNSTCDTIFKETHPIEIQKCFDIERNACILVPILKLQKEITDDMRVVIVDWLMMVASKIRICRNTFLHAIHIMDKYLSLASICKKDFQAISVTCLLIACKFNETECPSINNLTQYIGNSHSRESIIEWEQTIMKMIGFRIGLPLYDVFVEYYGRQYWFDHDKCYYYLYWISLVSELSVICTSLKVRLSISMILPEAFSDDLTQYRQNMENIMNKNTGRLCKSIEEIYK